MTKKEFVTKIPFVTAGNAFKGISTYKSRNNSDGGAVYYNNGLASTFENIPTEWMNISPFMDVYDEHNKYMCRICFCHGKINVSFLCANNFGENSSCFKNSLVGLFDIMEMLYGARPHFSKTHKIGEAYYCIYTI